MNLEFSPEDLAFQKEVQQWLETKYPADIRDRQNKGERLSKEDQVRWQRALNDQGWLAVNWPVEYGGTGWTPTQKYIFSNELAAANCPTVLPFGVSMVAPVIYSYGDEEQKKRFLPDILQSNVWWCQGYSEPDSGSDLASLKTKAELRGDKYLVNGSKTWTTLAQNADWIFCLVRTDGSGRKQDGITFLLIDMHSPGVEVRPIITIDGSHEVNSVFFTDVEVPVANRIGEEGKGWTYAKVLLQHERTGIAGVAASKRSLAQIKQVAAETPTGEGGNLMQDSAFARKVAEVELELLALEHTDLRVLSTVSAGKAPGPESSLLKIKGSELQQSITELAVEAAGYLSLPFFSAEHGHNEPPVGPDWVAGTAPSYLNYRKTTIYGGSNEIQKNIIAKAVLGL